MGKKKVWIINKYDFSYVYDFIKDNNCLLLDENYFDCKQQLHIQCNCTRTFITTFDAFKNKNKRQCNECSKLKIRITLDDVKLHINQYAVGYTVLDIKVKNQKSYIFIKCPIEEHKPYWVSWEKFKRGQRCQKCYYNKRLNKPDKWDKENIVNLLNENNLTIIDDNYEFNNAKKKIKCINNDGYIVDVLINSLQMGMTPHIFQKNKYAIINLKLLCERNNLVLDEGQIWKGIKKKYNACTQEGYRVFFNTETLLNNSKPRIFHFSNPYSIDNINLYCKINNPDYEIISNQYIHRNKKLLFKYIGNVEMLDDERYFEVNLERFIYHNQGHPSFKQSKGENVIRNWLIKNKISFKKQYTFSDCKNVSLLRFDFAIFNDIDKTDLKCLIEYDGKQHFEQIDYFGGENGFLYTQHNDKIKNYYCNDNNIELIRIPYWEYKNIPNILETNLL